MNAGKIIETSQNEIYQSYGLFKIGPITPCGVFRVGSFGGVFTQLGMLKAPHNLELFPFSQMLFDVCPSMSTCFFQTWAPWVAQGFLTCVSTYHGSKKTNKTAHFFAVCWAYNFQNCFNFFLIGRISSNQGILILHTWRRIYWHLFLSLLLLIFLEHYQAWLDDLQMGFLWGPVGHQYKLKRFWTQQKVHSFFLEKYQGCCTVPWAVFGTRTYPMGVQ